MRGPNRIRGNIGTLPIRDNDPLSCVLRMRANFFQTLGIRIREVNDLRGLSNQLNLESKKRVAELIEKLTDNFYTFGDCTFTGQYTEKPFSSKKHPFPGAFVFLFYRIPKGYAKLGSPEEKKMLLAVFEDSFYEVLPRSVNADDLDRMMTAFARLKYFEDVVLFYANPLWFFKIPPFSLPLIKKILDQRYDLVAGIAQGANPIIRAMEFFFDELCKTGRLTTPKPNFVSLLFSAYDLSLERNRKLWGDGAANFLKGYRRVLVVDDIYDNGSTLPAFVETLHFFNFDLEVEAGVLLSISERRDVFSCIEERNCVTDWKTEPRCKGSELIKNLPENEGLARTRQYQVLINFIRTRLTFVLPRGREYDDMIFCHLMRLLPQAKLVWEKPFPWLVEELKTQSLMCDAELFNRVGEAMQTLVGGEDFKGAYREEYSDFDYQKRVTILLRDSEQGIRYLEEVAGRLLDDPVSRKLILHYLFTEDRADRLCSLFDIINFYTVSREKIFRREKKLAYPY